MAVTPEMRKLRKAWILALKSRMLNGKPIKQTRQRLANKKRDAFCCLGVACELVSPGYSTYTKFFMPNSVIDAFGFRSERGGMPYGGRDVPHSDLSLKNDSSHWNFRQIAEYVEARPDLIFKEV